MDGRFEAPQPRDARGERPHAAGAGNQHALSLPWHSLLDFRDLPECLLDNRHRLEQHRDVAQRLRNRNEKFRLFGITLGEVAVAPPDAALLVIAARAEVIRLFAAGSTAFRAGTPD